MASDIIVKLRLAGEEFSRAFDAEFDKLERSAETRSRGAGGRSGGAFAAAFGAGLATLGTVIGVAISESADLGASIASTSRQFNIGAEELQVWRFAAQQSGVTASQLDGSLADLTRRIGEANAGNRNAQQGFVDLGLSFQTTSGQARATDAVLLDLANRISSIEDPSERVRLGTQLLGEEFDNLYPLLLSGADGFNAASAELDRFGGALSADEVQNLQETNAKIEQLKNVLSIRIAGVVAENQEAIEDFTLKLVEFGIASINAANDWLTFRNAQVGRSEAVAALSDDLSPDARREAIAGIDARAGRRETVTSSYLGGLVKFKQVEYRPDGRYDDVSLYTDANRAELERFLRPNTPTRLTPSSGPVAGRGGGGRARRGGGASPVDREAEAAAREAERAAQAAIRNEEQLREAIERTIQAQEDSADVERTRAEQGEVAAAALDAQLTLQRQQPLLLYDQVDALAVALGITKDLTEEDRKRLQILIDQGNAAEQAAMDSARADAQSDLDREAARQQEEAERRAAREAEAWQRAHELAVLDVADLYETAMRRGVDGIFDHFKDEGLRIIAEIAAQWTLAMVAGNPFDLGSAATNAAGRSPLSSIFFGAANDNGLAGLFGPGIGSGEVGEDFGRGSTIYNRSAAGDIAAVKSGVAAQKAGAASADLLGEIGLAFALGQAGIAIGGNTGFAGQAFGLGGALGGQALGASIGALGSFGGPIGAIAGGLIGNLLGGLVGKGAAGSATIGGSGANLGITGTLGGSGTRRDAASQSAGSLIDTVFALAEQLGASVDASRASLSIGLRDDDIRVDPTGRGRTKIGDGAVDFGQDEEAAIAFALRDLISDGVITGLSDVARNLLNRPNSDLEAQIEKALLIEQVPELLKQRLDPLGAALDDVYDRFKLLADALREGGANAEQLAEAQKLYELEKAEAIASIGAASQTLQDFLESLNAGSNSPLSLRQQRAEAEAQLAPFVEQIAEAEAARAEVDRLRASGADAATIEAAETAARTAAAAIDQSGFTDAGQLLLSISRQSNASSAAFFSDFDRIRALTGGAVGLLNSAAPAGNDSRDPFSQEIARNTADAAFILSDTFAVQRRQMEILESIDRRLGGGGGSGFIGEARAFAS